MPYTTATPKYTLAVCQSFDPGLHGYGPDMPSGRFLVIDAVDCHGGQTPLVFLDSWVNLTPFSPTQQFVERATQDMRSRVHSCEEPVIAWRQIRDFPIVDIVSLEESSNGYVTGVKKTFWLSVFKRLWRRKRQTVPTSQFTKRFRDDSMEPDSDNNGQKRMKY